MVRFRPGTLVYLSESDTEVDKEKLKHTKQHAASSRRSSPRTPNLSNCQNPQMRSSERIRKKQSQSFKKPTREQVMSKIDTLKTPSKVLDQLKPRRLVNDFTKERNRYNYDPDYTSGESSIDNFIDDEDDESDSCSLSEKSSLSDETESPVQLKKNKIYSRGKKPNVAKTKFTKTKAKRAKVAEENTSNSEDEHPNVSTKSRAMKANVSKGNVSDSDDENVNSSTKTRVIISSSDANSSDSDIVQPGRQKNLKRCRASAQVASQGHSSDDNSIIAPRQGAKRKLRMRSDSSEASDASNDSQVETASRNKDEDDDYRQHSDHEDKNDSESEDNSSHNELSSYHGHFHSPRAELMQRKRDEKKKLFSKLIQTRKRKNSNGKL